MALNTSHQLKYGQRIYSHEFGYWSILSLQQHLSLEKLFMIFSLVNEVLYFLVLYFIVAIIKK